MIKTKDKWNIVGKKIDQGLVTIMHLYFEILKEDVLPPSAGMNGELQCSPVMKHKMDVLHKCLQPEAVEPHEALLVLHRGSLALKTNTE